MRRLARRVLEGGGYQVLEAASGKPFSPGSLAQGVREVLGQ